MNDWKKIVRISRLIPLVDGIYCLVFSICDTFDPYVIYKSQKMKKELQFKNCERVFFSLLVFLSLIVFLQLFHFIFCQFRYFSVYKRKKKKNAMWQQKNIHHATSHVQKVHFTIVYCSVAVVRVCTNLNRLSSNDEKIRTNKETT